MRNHRPNSGNQPKAWDRLLRRLPRIDPALTLLWGFNSEREFYICLIPCCILSIIGLLLRDLLIIVIGVSWFFGFYALFVFIDTMKASKAKRKQSPERPAKGGLDDDPDPASSPTTPWSLRLLIIFIGLVAFGILIKFWPDTASMLIPE